MYKNGLKMGAPPDFLRTGDKLGFGQDIAKMVEHGVWVFQLRYMKPKDAGNYLKVSI